MKRLIIFLLLMVFSLSISIRFLTEPVLGESQITMTILYDNYRIEESLESLTSIWGFSCLIQGTEKTILFDTGEYGNILISNSEKLNTNLDSVQQIVLSHRHRDHTGGLETVLEKTSGVSVYIPYSLPENFDQKITMKQATPIRVNKPMKICENVYTTGEMFYPEQSLILDTREGLVIITGCAHPGIVNIVQKAKEIHDKEIYMAFGGFHMLKDSDDRINKNIQKLMALGVKKIGPSHCTGDRAIELFKQAYGDNYIPMGVGKVVRVAK